MVERVKSCRRLRCQWRVCRRRRRGLVVPAQSTSSVNDDALEDKDNGEEEENEEESVPRWSLTTSTSARLHGVHRTDLAVVLVEPAIPQNTGSIARSCAAARVGLHLVEPIAFELDSKKLKRAGLDYWESVCVNIHSNWDAFLEYYDHSVTSPKRLFAYSKRGTQLYSDVKWSETGSEDRISFLIFGSETTGLSDAQIDDVLARSGPDACLRIPIVEEHVRSLNLAVSAGIGLYDAIRQIDSYAATENEERKRRERLLMYERPRASPPS